jgi:hypothetical protein
MIGDRKYDIFEAKDTGIDSVWETLINLMLIEGKQSLPVSLTPYGAIWGSFLVSAA